LAFFFVEVNALKRQFKREKTAISKKKKAESLISTEINLTTSSDEDTSEEYFFKQQKKARFESNAGSGKKSLIFLFEEINALKRQLKPEKTAISKKRKAEYLLSTEINLTTSSDEGEQQ
jgi:hypothetical protein